METEIISNLITVAPVVGVLVWVVLNFRAEKKDLIEKNDSLQDELRASEREAITVIKDLNVTLQALIVELKTK